MSNGWIICLLIFGNVLFCVLVAYVLWLLWG